MKIKKATAALCATVIALGMTACGTEDPADTTMGVTETMDSSLHQDIVDMVEDIGEENSKTEVGKYVVPAESDFTVEDADSGVKITKYTGTETAIEIPAQIGGKDVVSIGERAFYKSGVIGVKLPDTVVTLEEEAFAFSTKLTEITLGANVKELGEYSLSGCAALTNINFNNNLEVIGDSAFGMTTSLKEVNLPDSLKEIAGGAFVMGGLERITIPGSVKTIGVQAFSTMNNLQEVIIENGVKKIDETAFEYNNGLTQIVLPESLEEIGWAILQGCENVVIYGTPGSMAESYANENEIEFKSK